MHSHTARKLTGSTALKPWKSIPIVSASSADWNSEQNAGHTI